jgi:hypothetical protein
MGHRVAQFQQAEGVIFLSAPVSGEKSLPPCSNFTDPAKTFLVLKPVSAARMALLAIPNFMKLRRVKLFIIFFPYCYIVLIL